MYALTVRDLRSEHKSAAIGILMPAATMLITSLIFYWFMNFIGGRSAPIRTDFLTFIFAGFMVFFFHIRTLGAVTSAMTNEGMLKHKRATPFLLICVKAFGAGYKMSLAMLILMAANYLFRDVWAMQDGLVYLFCLFLAWLGAVAIGIMMMAINRYFTWGALIQTTYIRICFLTSGKFMVAAQTPNFMRDVMGWNPIFHILDQLRGAMFVNYAARTTDLLYPVAVYGSLIVVALLVENFVRTNYSASHHPIG
ncbi:MAG: ABC transporter permease [Pseudomonadota bacterium]